MVKNNKNTTNVGGLNRVPPYSFSGSGFNYDPLAEQLGSENIQIEGKRALKQTLNKRGITTELDSAVRNNIPYEEAKSSLSTEQNKGGAKQIDEKTHQTEQTKSGAKQIDETTHQVEEDNNPFAMESPYLPMQTKFDKALFGSDKDSPFVTSLKEQAVTSDLYFSTDRTDLQYKQDKPKYEQEAKDRAKYMEIR